MKIKEDKIINGVLIPKGTEVQFSNEGFCVYKGQAFHKSEVALEDEGLDEAPVEEASALPDILFKTGDAEQFWLKHGDFIRMHTLNVVKHQDQGPSFDNKTIGFAWPSDSKQARAIIQLMVESGYAGDDILERWPELMNCAGYVEAGELNDVWKRRQDYNAANGHRGGISAIESMFCKRKKVKR